MKDIEATRFVLKNEDGNVVGEWTADTDGSSMRFLAGENGKKMINIVAGSGKQSFSFISINDKHGTEGVCLGYHMKGEYFSEDYPFMDIYDSRGRRRMLLAVDKDGPSLNVLDDKMKPRAVIGTNALQGVGLPLRGDPIAG